MNTTKTIRIDEAKIYISHNIIYIESDLDDIVIRIKSIDIMQLSDDKLSLSVQGKIFILVDENNENLLDIFDELRLNL